MRRIVVTLIILVVFLSGATAAAGEVDSGDTSNQWGALVDSNGTPIHPWMVTSDDWEGYIPIIPQEPGNSINSGNAPTSIVTYHIADGTITETDIGDLLNGTGTASYSAYQGEIPQSLTIENVIKPDDRVRITPTTGYPWRTICKIFMTAPDGLHYMGSGFLIGSPDGHGYYALTAAHCIYNNVQNSAYDGFMTEVVVIPGKDGDIMPFRYAYATDLSVMDAWIDSASGDYRYDWGLITLDRSIGDITGWMGLTTADPSDPMYTGLVHTAGYPGDLDGGANMYYTSALGLSADETNHYYYLDSYGGQSGSAVWIIDQNTSEPRAVTVHAYGSSGYNFGTRLSQSNLDILAAWQAASVPPVDKPDLVDDGQAFSNFTPAYVDAGITSFDIDCRVRNIGTAASGSCGLSFYASEDTDISSSDYLIASTTVPAITRFNTTVVSWSGTFPETIPNGTYYIGWLIDDESEVVELDELNNGATAEGRLQVGITPNTPPNTPSSPSPANGATGRIVTVDLSWSGGDPDDGDIVTYDLYLGTSPTPALVGDDLTATTYDPGRLIPETTYYWQIVSEDDRGGITSGPVWSFSTGTDQNVIGRIEAEDYNAGSEGVAYHDTTAGNEGGSYRTDDVDIHYVDGEGSYVVGWTHIGEWLKYSVDAGAGGSYIVSFRVATPANNRVITLKNGEQTLCTVNVPNTGSYNTFTTVTKTITLPAGERDLTLSIDTDAVNVNWMDFKFATASVPRAAFSSSLTTGPAPLIVKFSDESPGLPSGWLWNFGDTETSTAQNPSHVYDSPGLYSVTLTVNNAYGTSIVTYEDNILVTAPAPTPFGRIEAEEYDTGGEGVGYHDTSLGNNGSAFRDEDVDILYSVEEQNYAIAWVYPDEWLNYQVQILDADTYTVEFRVATPLDSRSFTLKLDGSDLVVVTVPNTGSYLSYTTVTRQVALPSGLHNLTVVFDTGGVDLNYMEFS